MTCIVGMGDGRCMAIGGDSAATNDADDSLDIRRDRKVFTIKQIKGPDAIIGFCGSFRIGQILMDLLLPEDKSKSDDWDGNHGFLRKEVVPIVRELLTEGGVVGTLDGMEVGGDFLLGYRNWIYKFDTDFAVGGFWKPYFSLGSGAHFANGALEYALKYTEYAQMDLSQDTMVEIIKRVLDITALNIKNVAGPMIIIASPVKKIPKPKSVRRVK